MEHDTEPRHKFIHVRLLIFYEVLKTHNGEMSLQQLLLGKTGYQHAKNEIGPLHHNKKLNSKWIKDFKHMI